MPEDTCILRELRTMLLKSRDRKTVLNIGEIAGLEVSRGKVYLQGQERPIVGYVINAILAHYNGQVGLGGYEAEDEALRALEAIENWIEQGGNGIFEIA